MAEVIYRPGAKHNFPQASYHPSNRATNQIVFSGADVIIPVENGIFWLEQLHASAPVSFTDGDSVSILPSIKDVDCEMSPMRCDHGIKIDGDIYFGKGFITEDCLS